MAETRDTTNSSVMVIKDGSDKYQVVSGGDRGRFRLYATLVQSRFIKDLEPKAVEGLRILLEQDHEDCVLALAKAIVPE